MEQKKNNGFATEKEYEAVKNIILPGIDDYTDTVMIICHTLQNGRKNVEVLVDTKSGHSLRYHMDEDGVFYVNTEGENFPIQECKILVTLNDAAWGVFQEVNGNAAKENLKKFLGGDESTLTDIQVVRASAIDAKAKFGEAINAKKTKIEKDTIRDIGYGVALWRDEDIFPILEEHYGITVTNKGNKYCHFKYNQVG